MHILDVKDDDGDEEEFSVFHFNEIRVQNQEGTHTFMTFTDEPV